MNNNQKKRLLILGAPVFQIPVVQKAKDMGLYVGLVDIDEKAPARPFADEFFVSSIKDYDSCLEICKKFKPNGIMAGCCDTSVVTVSLLCEALNLPGNSVSCAINATDKYKMIETFSSCGVAHPSYQLLTKKMIESNQYSVSLNYPLICKPIDCASSRGVFLIEDSTLTSSCISFSSEKGGNGDVLLEEYLTGPEVSVEVFVLNSVPYVLQVTDKITSGSPHFVEVGQTQPSTLSSSVLESVKKLATKAVLAVGIENGPAHVEMKITDFGPKMIELGARMGGDAITTYLIDNSICGVNMTELCIKSAIGDFILPLSYSNTGVYCSFMAIEAKEGVLKSVDCSKVVSDESLVNIAINGVVGKTYHGTENNSDRIGFVVAKGKTKELSLENCKKVVDSISVIFE